MTKIKNKKSLKTKGKVWKVKGKESKPNENLAEGDQKTNTATVPPKPEGQQPDKQQPKEQQPQQPKEQQPDATGRSKSDGTPAKLKVTKKGKKPSMVSKDDGKQKKKVEQKKKVAGVIFMCNTSTKQDCYKHRVFGLPEANKKIVEKVTRGMKLFLFDIDLRLLYGIYEASTPGGFNLVAKAFRGSVRSFPAQVRFRVYKDCLPLAEDIFKNAIKDNYYGKNKFNVELNADQVNKLCQLFRPVESAPRRVGGEARRQVRVLRGGSRYDRSARMGRRLDVAPNEPDLTRQRRARREQAYSPYYNGDSRQIGIADYVPPTYSRVPAYGMDPIHPEVEPRRLDYVRDTPLLPADPYPRENVYSAAYTRHVGGTSLIPVPEVSQVGHALINPEVELLGRDSLYRQRLQLDGRGYLVEPPADANLIRKRPFEEAYVDDRVLPAPKRAHLQEELLYRDIDYQLDASQRAISANAYFDERLARRNPWEGNGVMQTAPGSTSYAALTQPLARHYAGGQW